MWCHWSKFCSTTQKGPIIALLILYMIDFRSSQSNDYALNCQWHSKRSVENLIILHLGNSLPLELESSFFFWCLNLMNVFLNCTINHFSYWLAVVLATYSLVRLIACVQIALASSNDVFVTEKIFLVEVMKARPDYLLWFIILAETIKSGPYFSLRKTKYSGNSSIKEATFQISECSLCTSEFKVFAINDMSRTSQTLASGYIIQCTQTIRTANPLYNYPFFWVEASNWNSALGSTIELLPPSQNIINSSIHICLKYNNFSTYILFSSNHNLLPLKFPTNLLFSTHNNILPFDSTNYFNTRVQSKTKVVRTEIQFPKQ